MGIDCKLGFPMAVGKRRVFNDLSGDTGGEELVKEFG